MVNQEKLSHRASLKKSLEGVQLIVSNSNSKKSAELQKIFDHIFGQGYVSVLMMRELSANYVESALHNSEIVAMQKAQYFQKKLGSELPTAGADTTFAIKSERQWKYLSKLSRLKRKLTDEEIAKQYDSLYKELCIPDGGVGEVMWDMSLAVVNGVSRIFNEKIYIKYSSVDRKLFDDYFWNALEKGYLYKYNSRIEMIEMLAKSGSIQKMAFLEEGGKMSRLIRDPSEFLLRVAIEDISTTMPIALFRNLASDLNPQQQKYSLPTQPDKESIEVKPKLFVKIISLLNQFKCNLLRFFMHKRRQP